MIAIHAISRAVHNGFSLSNDIDIEGDISIFVGRNGSGKSRFFQSIKSGATQVFLNGVDLITTAEITLMPLDQIVPNFGMHHDFDNLMLNISNTIRVYKEARQLVGLPYDHGNENHFMGRPGSGPTYSQIYRLSNFIANKTGKLPGELTEEDIKLYYTEVSNGPLGTQNVAGIFNRYAKRQNDNRYNKWRREENEEDVPYLDENSFREKFGEPPWNVINHILAVIFDGKFYFPPPGNLKSVTYDHQTPLMEKGDRRVNPSDLSSGEKTLLWLALSLFNAQYSERDLLVAPKLLLLDEIDAFLHPKMVEKMYEVFKEFHKSFGTIFWVITHSPTTAALAPVDILYLVEPTGISRTDKDGAIAELLDGVSQIAIRPENRRSVYVESHYDAKILQPLYDFLRKRSNVLDPKISVNFIPSGSKVSEPHIASMAKKYFGNIDETLLNNFVSAVNGSGSCSQVYSSVEFLNQGDSDLGVKGLVDWDASNKSTEFVSVLGEGYAYSIENVILDPACVLLQLHLIDAKKYSLIARAGVDVTWAEWLAKPELLQAAIDHFLSEILDSVNDRNAEILYVSGISLKSDVRYLQMRGHDLEDRLWNRFPELNRIARRSHDGDLKLRIAQNIMIGASSGRLIPKVVEEAFIRLQS
ncbi:MAG TPA: AAA family ATPase [Burkholderiaceae bacterium]|nr:AAA family ATPase [Burkholderiaceae bacterium]